MKKAANAIFVSLGILFIIGAMVVTIIREKEDTSFYENRSLAAMPEFETEALLSGSYFSDLESYLSDHAAARNTLLKLNTKIDLLLQRPVVNDVVVSTDDGSLLPYIEYEIADEDNLQAQADILAENLSSINEAVTEYGGYYCYVAVPIQYDVYKESYPWYLNNGSETTELSLSALGRSLDAAGVPWYDLGTVFYAQDNPQYYYSLTDHHYNMYGAFLAYQSVLSFLNNETDSDIPILQDEDVTITELSNYFMGSKTRSIFNLITSQEHLYTLLPVHEIAFTRYNYGTQGDSTVYSWIASSSETVYYTYYMGGDIGETIIETNRDELPDILIYGDSFTNAMECVLYLSCDTMYSIDLRYYSGTITDYIEKYQPDYVICLRSYESLLSTDGNGGI